MPGLNPYFFFGMKVQQNDEEYKNKKSNNKTFKANRQIIDCIED